MIDDKINKTLTDLEASLTNVKSAQQQVQDTVNSFNGLKSATSSYVSSLNEVNSNVTSLVKLIGNDYNKNVKTFENDRKEIVDSCSNAIQALNNAAEEVKVEVFEKINSFDKKLNIIMATNGLIFVVMIVLFFLFK